VRNVAIEQRIDWRTGWQRRGDGGDLASCEERFHEAFRDLRRPRDFARRVDVAERMSGHGRAVREQKPCRDASNPRRMVSILPRAAPVRYPDVVAGW
jgi:hypothetical protein